ncbi:hypothetical protein F5Y17DRAFT_425146 [Xylariaceae sp. FL0594]|nr:hypothetical protein F5Y17DRAFT_425146 [Xylariaceae sp. FL0594]
MEEEARRHDDDSAVVTADQQAPCFLRRTCFVTWNNLRHVRSFPSSSGKPPYPSISGIPKTSPDRLALAAGQSDAATAKTVLYLAYGSNLSAETFLGMRGIRPVSQINVSAPAFDLAFNLPGLPYVEPCFANTRPRKGPRPPNPVPVPVPGKPPKFPPSPPPAANLLSPSLPDRGPTWSKGLYGVVYEVTPEDYATIIKTEGGGQGYKDVLTPCFELPSAVHIPEKPPFPDLPPKPFFAHTLYAPFLPDVPDDRDHDDDHDRNDGDRSDKPNVPRKTKSILQRLLLPVHRTHPFEDYAQPSARYLKLIRDGAREHSLPEDYQLYLSKLEAYALTRRRQHVGRVLFLLFAVPFLAPLLLLGRLFADDRGRNPRWLGLLTTAAMNWCWMVYDAVFKPHFGDGERTMPPDDEHDHGKDGDGSASMAWTNIKSRMKNTSATRGTDGTEDEKSRLLSDW